MYNRMKEQTNKEVDSQVLSTGKKIYGFAAQAQRLTQNFEYDYKNVHILLTWIIECSWCETSSDSG
jgi:hypothetical protein